MASEEGVADNNNELLAWMKQQEAAATRRREVRTRVIAFVCVLAVAVGIGTWATLAARASDRAHQERVDEIVCHMLDGRDC
jgi:hypothetical protein